jgi:hypothetical protein
MATQRDSATASARPLRQTAREIGGQITTHNSYLKINGNKRNYFSVLIHNNEFYGSYKIYTLFRPTQHIYLFILCIESYAKLATFASTCYLAASEMEGGENI